MPFNKSFIIPFFKLLILSLVIAFINYSFILYKGTSESLTKSKLLTFPDYMLTIIYYINNFKHLLLLSSGDIEANTGLKRSSNIKFCQWNINGLAAHDFIKVPLKRLLSKPAILT